MATQPFNSILRFSKSVLNELVIAWRENGQKPVSVNTYLTFLNAFLRWLHEEEHIKDLLIVKKLRVEQNVYKVFTITHMKIIVNHKPKNFYERRMQTALLLLLDTGLKIDECLLLKLPDVLLDQLYVIVMGKGGKERIVPFSNPLRRTLHLYLKERKQPGDYVFATGTGGRVSQRNFLRDMKTFCSKLGIEGIRISPHTLRHSFAIYYLGNGGDLFTLSKILGHTSISTTQIYLRSISVDQIRESHARLSPLSRLK